MKIFGLIFTLITCVSFLSGCNTVQGIGEDVEAGGKALQKAAD